MADNKASIVPFGRWSRQQSIDSTSSAAAQVLEDCLFSRDSIDLAELRKLSSGGLPEEDDGASRRGLVWRVLLGYLPVDVDDWSAILEGKRALYRSFVEELFYDARDASEKGGLELRHRPRRAQRPVEAEPEDAVDRTPPKPSRPIPPAIQESWKKAGKDLHVLQAIMATTSLNALHCNEDSPEDFVRSASLLDEIRKDVLRTHPDLAFYLSPVDNRGRRRYAALERILFVYATYNRGVRYVQGMNEIVATLYYVLAYEADEQWSMHAEADTYFLFEIVVGDMRDVFLPDLDQAHTGIQGRINEMQALLTKHDPEVAEHLKELGIDASFYAIRWWTTLLSREFLLPDTIRLWDAMFASTHRDNFLRYVCVTMVGVIRDDLLQGDFSSCLRLLQAYPSTHMDRLLESSRALWIYESQITIACQKTGISLHQALSTIHPRPCIIIAYGLRGGMLQSMEQDRTNARTAAQSSAASLLGRARGLYSRYSREVQERLRQSTSYGAEEDTAREEEEQQQDALSQLPPDNPEDSIYLDAILKA